LDKDIITNVVTKIIDIFQIRDKKSDYLIKVATY